MHDQTTYLYADGVTVEADEDGFHLILDTYDGRFNIRVQAIAEELYEAVVRQIGPWLAEGKAARLEYLSGVSGDAALQHVLDRIRAPEEERWASEDALSYFRRTGDDEPLREMGDLARKAERER